VLDYLQLEHAPSPAVTRLFEKRRGVAVPVIKGRG
jgi:hypothetical protein